MVGMEVVCRKIGSSHLFGEFRTCIRFSALILGISHLYRQTPHISMYRILKHLASSFLNFPSDGIILKIER